jgi:hypothetical protein
MFIWGPAAILHRAAIRAYWTKVQFRSWSAVPKMDATSMRLPPPTLRLCAMLLAAGSIAFDARGASDLLSAFKDRDDGAIDLSEWLLDRKGFLPVPIIITEPAVGNGGGVALLFFRESIREVAGRAQGGHIAPPDILGAAAIATENGTKAFGAGGMLSFADDRCDSGAASPRPT